MLKAVVTELKEKRMLRSRQPTQKAYRVAVNTIDDHSVTVKELYDHAKTCGACNRKLERALREKERIIRAQLKA
jgi:hypothetical protein